MAGQGYTGADRQPEIAQMHSLGPRLQ
jgi:hypothetical protein